MNDTESLERQYELLKPKLDRCLAEVRPILAGLLGEMVSSNLMRAELATARVKGLASIRLKARENDWSEAEALANVSDLVGFRVVCHNLEDLARIRDLIIGCARFEIVPGSIQDYVEKPQGSGYRALHLTIIYTVEGPEPVPVKCEIQIKTLAQDMWGVLTHQDIYKQRGTVPPHIVTLSRRLSNLLSVADEIAQDICEQISAPLAASRGTSNELKPETLAFIYQRAFGEEPPDYLVRAVLERCEQVGCFRLDLLDRVLQDKSLREAVAQAYKEVTSWPLTDQTWFDLAPDIAIRPREEAIELVVKRGQMERDEIDSMDPSEFEIVDTSVLDELPDTFHELINVASS